MRTPKMTKAHFELVANVIDSWDGLEDQKLELADLFAEQFEATNPAFDAYRFRMACVGRR
jgi:hypothetical protein